MRQLRTQTHTAGWSEVVVEVRWAPGRRDPGQTPLLSPEALASSCMLQHRMRLLGRYISRDGSKHIYVFSAPDAESVRRVVESYVAPLAPLQLSVWSTRG